MLGVGAGMTAAALWAALAQFHSTRLAMQSVRTSQCNI
jgi:ribose 5-phosphate isomerase